MFELADGLRKIVDYYGIAGIGRRILVIADDEGQSTWLGQILTGVLKSIQLEPVLVVISGPETRSTEPPKPVVAAMKESHIVISVSDKAPLVHTTARKEAMEMGVKFFHLPVGDLSIDEIKAGGVTAFPKDVLVLKEKTDALTELLTEANSANVISPAGTDIKLSLTGRRGISLHPLNLDTGRLGDYYAEAAIAPVEGTAQGVIVVDIGMIDWGYLLRKPIRIEVKNGQVHEIIADNEDSKKLRDVLDLYENSGNIGELGVGTSHIMPLPMKGSRRDAARLGTVHFGLGRNNDIGGLTYGRLHLDALMDQVRLELDGRRVLENGTLFI